MKLQSLHDLIKSYRISSASDNGSENELCLDSGGGIVPFPAETWYVGFVPALDRRLWHSFVHPRHKHCFALRPVKCGWLVFEPWWARTPLTVISGEQASKFFLWAARGDMLMVREETPGRSSQLRGMMTCAALLAHMLGRPYHVLTPHALFRRLDLEDETVRIDAENVAATLRFTDSKYFGGAIKGPVLEGVAV